MGAWGGSRLIIGKIRLNEYYFQPGEVYDDDEDPCYSCQCVGGEVICDRKCPIPTCADVSITAYPLNTQLHST